jgi:hypothetical protein
VYTLNVVVSLYILILTLLCSAFYKVASAEYDNIRDTGGRICQHDQEVRQGKVAGRGRAEIQTKTLDVSKQSWFGVNQGISFRSSK